MKTSEIIIEGHQDFVVAKLVKLLTEYTALYNVDSFKAFVDSHEDLDWSSADEEVTGYMTESPFVQDFLKEFIEKHLREICKQLPALQKKLYQEYDENE